jgi:hypothetical protein
MRSSQSCGLVLAALAFPRRWRFPVLVNLNRNIKLVVIVNAARAVDKADFFNMLKGLPAFAGAEQTLFLAGTLTGQKIGAA